MSKLALRAAAAATLLAPGLVLAQGTPATRPAPTGAAPPAVAPAVSVIKVDGRQLRPGTWTYSITATGNGKTQTSTRDLSISPATVNGAAAWLIADGRGDGAMRVADSLYLTRNDLQPLRHLLRMGPVTLLLNYSKDSVTGTATLPQGSARIAAEHKRGAMASGTMFEVYLRMMPLKTGWKGNMEMSAVGPQGNVLIPVAIAVTGEESVTVPAGTFPCFVVSIKGQGTEQKAWVSKNTRDIVKVSALFTQPAGASFETVLVAKKS